jgi:hypothetical protein
VGIISTSGEVEVDVKTRAPMGLGEVRRGRHGEG